MDDGLASHYRPRRVLARSARCEGSRTELTPVQHSTVGYSRLSVNQTGPVKNEGLVAAHVVDGSALCGELSGTVLMRAPRPARGPGGEDWCTMGDTCRSAAEVGPVRTIVLAQPAGAQNNCKGLRRRCFALAGPAECAPHPPNAV